MVFQNQLIMAEVFKHALGICGDHWHPNLLTLLLGGVGISTIYSYVILYLKCKFKNIKKRLFKEINEFRKSITKFTEYR